MRKAIGAIEETAASVSEYSFLHPRLSCYLRLGMNLSLAAKRTTTSTPSMSIISTTTKSITA